MRIDELAVTPKLVEAVLRFDEDEAMRTSSIAGFAGSLIAFLPGLKGHRCDNGAGRTFLDELEDTELAHVVEHAALEIMAMAGSRDTLEGRTSWDFAADGRGVFRVRIACDDEVVAVGALRCAASLVASMSEGTEPPDVDAEAVRLKRARRWR